jgi:Zn-dependent M28 family amino/carboxypeptidase
MKRFLLILFLLAGMPGWLQAQTDFSDAFAALNEHVLRAHIKFLADDLQQGRAPGSTGSRLAQKYIAAQFERLGLEPGYNGSYFQPFDIVEVDIDPDMTLSVKGKKGQIVFRYYDEFIANPGQIREEVRIRGAELVFVGYGIQAPEYNWDDFKNVDVRGKVLLVMNNDPDHGDPNFFGGKARLYYGRWDYKYRQAQKMGAAGAIIIHTTPSAGYPWKVVQTSWSGKQYVLPEDKEPMVPYAGWVTEDAAYRIARLAGFDLDELRARAEKRDFRPVPLGIKVKAVVRARYRTFKTANVIGVLPGKDPELAKQAVVFTAHYDHLGIGTPVEGDSIYNGALDNASGVASLLALAEAFQRLPERPRRSLVFLAVDGEESGLLGSQYYAEHPTFPPEKIAANVNIDGANIWGKTRDVSIIGSGKSTIDDLVKEVARKYGRVVLPDQMPDKGYFYRSDQFNFAKIGVPALYLDNGLDFIGRPKDWGRKKVDEWVAVHYHQPTDEYNDDWDLSGQVEDLKLIFHVSYLLANRDRMPEWLPTAEFQRPGQ